MEGVNQGYDDCKTPNLIQTSPLFQQIPEKCAGMEQ